ncbi:MAG: DUF4783 domain-containing protein [Chitinophagales bacterium]
MKNQKKYISAALFALSICFYAFTQHPGINNIAAKMRAGDAAGVAAYFDGNIEMSILGKDAYNKATATTAIKTFFGANQPSGFTIKHEGTAPNGSQYVIGNLTTSSGDYRAYIVVNGDTIQELTIENW